MLGRLVSCAAVFVLSGWAISGRGDEPDWIPVSALARAASVDEFGRFVQSPEFDSNWSVEEPLRGNGLEQEPRAYGDCQPHLFLEGLIESDVSAWMRKHKEELVFMPSDEAKRREYRARLQLAEGYLERFYSGLEFLSIRYKTLALVYAEVDGDSGDRNTCAWLISDSGILAHAALQPRTSPSDNAVDDDFLKMMWAGLRVDVRSAARNPRKREPGAECDDSAPSDITPTSDDQSARMTSSKPAERGFLPRLSSAPSSRDVATTLSQVKSYLMPDTISAALEREAEPGARLLIIPARSAQKVPFAAFPIAEGHLVDLFALMIVPSAESVVRAARQEEPPQTTKRATTSLVVGDPDLSHDSGFCWPKLPYAREEAEILAKRLGIAAAIGNSANFKAISSQMKKGQSSLRLIYFATHGVTDPVNPADGSFLALAGNHMTGAALRKLKLKFARRPIVVMSACFSGLGKVFPGGLFGLTDFWLGAGASQVVVSLWAVSDSGTRDLMASFGSELSEQLAAETSALEGEIALAKAMRELKQTEKDPAVWAAFVVVGEPSP